MKTQKAIKSKVTPEKTAKVKAVTTELTELNDPIYKEMVKCLEGRTLKEKMAAVVMFSLVSAEYHLPGKNIGNDFLRQWQNEVFTKPQGGAFGFMAGFAYAVNQIGV